MATPTFALDEKDYLDLESLKRNLNIGASFTDYDETLIACIKSVSRMLDRHSGREWWYQVDRVERHRPISQRFLLNSPPIHSVTSIDTFDNLDPIDSDYIDIESPKTATVYISRPLRREGVKNPGITGRVKEGSLRASYVITYTSGYETPTQTPVSGVDHLPWNVRQALLEIASHAFLSRAENLNIKREHLLESANWYDYAGAERLIASKLGRFGRLKQA